VTADHSRVTVVDVAAVELGALLFDVSDGAAERFDSN